MSEKRKPPQRASCTPCPVCRGRGMDELWERCLACDGQGVQLSPDDRLRCDVWPRHFNNTSGNLTLPFGKKNLHADQPATDNGAATAARAADPDCRIQLR